MINKNILEHAHHHGFSEEELYEAYKIFFGTLVSESRLKMINLLRKRKMNVSELIGELKMDQSAVSHDLSRLKSCGFVSCETEGKYRYYSLNDETIRPLMSLIEKHMVHNCIHILRGMKGGNENEK